jgi:hypothetical protein
MFIGWRPEFNLDRSHSSSSDGRNGRNLQNLPILWPRDLSAQRHTLHGLSVDPQQLRGSYTVDERFKRMRWRLLLLDCNYASHAHLPENLPNMAKKAGAVLKEGVKRKGQRGDWKYSPQGQADNESGHRETARATCPLGFIWAQMRTGKPRVVGADGQAQDLKRYFLSPK